MADKFQDELSAEIERAHRQGRNHVEINAGELHRIVGGYPSRLGVPDRMCRCQNVMREEFRRGQAEVIHQAGEVDPSALTIRYELPRPLAA